MYKSGLRRCVCCAVCAIAIAPIGNGFRAGAQTPSTELSFEVATVKPVIMDAAHPFNPSHAGPHVSPAGASYWSMTPASLIAHAYGVDLTQVTGPEWAKHDRFDIEARFPEGADSKDEPRMLQALLKDRFNLAFHIEKRELESYALVVGKHGAKLRPSLPDPPTAETDAPSKPGDGNAGEEHAKSERTKNPDGSITLNMGKKGTQTVRFDQENWANHFELSKITMADLAKYLRGCLLGVPNIVDETGIKGTYQVAFDCPLPGPRPGAGRDTAGGLAASDPQDDSSLTRSLDALGLKLEKRKILMDVYVMDHVERPSEN